MLVVVNKTSVRVPSDSWQRVFNTRRIKTDIAIVVVGEASMRRISTKYHGKKTATVLTFIYEDSADIIINVAAARRWAKKYHLLLPRVLTDWFIHALSYVS